MKTRSLILYCVASWLCLPAPLTLAERSPMPRMVILNTNDSSQLGLASPLQKGLGQLMAGTRMFQVYETKHSLAGFTPGELAKTFGILKCETLSFTYLERNRISVFLFDSSHPSDFIVSTQNLTDPPGGLLSSPYIESKFRRAQQEVVALYASNRFQPLPGTQVSRNNMSPSEFAEANRRHDEVRKLFREMASINDKPFYVGASIGMSRFNAGSNIASTVDVGAYGGFRLGKKVSWEVGLDFYSYSLLHSDLRYHIPLSQKYVYLSLSGGVGRFMGHLTENQGFSNPTKVRTGTMVFGPGVGLEIPLLGALMRTDLRFYTGSTQVFFGTYGVIFSL